MGDQKKRIDGSHEMSAACGRCGYKFDSVSSTYQPGDRPDNDDVSVCISCGYLEAFVVEGGSVTLRELTDSELRDALNSPDVKRVLVGIFGATP